MDFKITDIKQQTQALQNNKVNAAEQPKKTKEETAAPEKAYDAVSVQGDTVSISEAGKAAETQKDQSENESANSSEDGTVVLKATEEFVTEEAAEEEEIISTTNLSKYTKVELQQFYLDGDITKVEYDNELSSREVVS